MITRFLPTLLLLTVLCTCVSAQSKLKTEVRASIAAQYEQLTDLSDRIWSYEEIAFQEAQSADALKAYARANGFRIKENIGEIPTAFTAEFGSGKPVIGILGEFDALPGLSQETVPHKKPRNEGGAGHGCGHNLFGTASLSAATAIKKMIEEGKLQGTIRFYGTPAEEKYFGKLWMVRAGAFDDVDVVMDWHPSAQTKVGVQTGLALVDFVVEFRGQAAHAASDPWNGRDASDALELYAAGINYYREHVKPSVRIHYDIQQAGEVVNVVPDYARMWTRVRDADNEGVQVVYQQIQRIAEGAAMMANVDYELTLISGIHEVLVNRTGAEALQRNLEAMGPINYTEEEQAFARQIQAAVNKPEIGIESKIEPLEETLSVAAGGSTDVGDVSYVVPVVRLRATTAPSGTPWHSWAVVACGGMSIGHKGMRYAAEAMSMTMVDLFTDAKLRESIKAEFKEDIGDYEYKPMVPAGPPPVDSKF